MPPRDEVVDDEQVAGGAHRRDAVAGMRRALVELEVHVGGAGRVLHPGPVQVEESGARGALLVNAEELQVALVRRDTAVDDRRYCGVLLAALAERFVGRAAGASRPGGSR